MNEKKNAELAAVVFHRGGVHFAAYFDAAVVVQFLQGARLEWPLRIHGARRRNPLIIRGYGSVNSQTLFRDLLAL